MALGLVPKGGGPSKQEAQEATGSDGEAREAVPTVGPSDAVGMSRWRPLEFHPSSSPGVCWSMFSMGCPVLIACCMGLGQAE